jgi:serine/threonine-protein kinase HipA
MPTAGVYYNGRLAGVLSKTGFGDYRFIYETEYLSDPKMPAISLTLPKTNREYHGNQLFSFFSGLLAEGINKEIQCRLLKIDENDDFTRLIKTAGQDTIGAITVKAIKDEV